MSILGKIFKRKKYDDIGDLNQLAKNLPKMPESKPQTQEQSQEGKINLDNIKSKLDLILTDLDNIKIQNQMTSERLRNIEKALAEMKGIKYY